MRLRTLGIVLCIPLAAAMPAGPAEPTLPGGYIVIVHADNSSTRIDREQLSRIFMKRVAKWPSGVPTAPVDLAPGAQPRIAFTTEVHRKSVGAIRAFWQQQIFSGRDVPPPEKTSDADVTAYVKENAGGIGYISEGTQMPSGVKAIAVEGAGR